MNIVSLILPLLISVQLESATFTVFVNGRIVGTEDFSIGKSTNGYVARGRTRLNLDGVRVDAESRMDLDEDLNLVSYEYRSGTKIVRVNVGEELAGVEFIVDGASTPYDIRLPSGAMVIDDNFFHHYLLLLYKAAASGGDVPVFVPQQMTLGSVVVTPAGDNTYELDSDTLRLRATTDDTGRLLQLELPGANIVVRR